MAKVEHIVCDKCGRETDQKYYIYIECIAKIIAHGQNCLTTYPFLMRSSVLRDSIYVLNVARR